MHLDYSKTPLLSVDPTPTPQVLRQQWVFGGICRETTECFMYTMPDRSAATLLPIIRNSIRPGTTVHSDLWRAYDGIAVMGFNHLTVNHSLNFVDLNTGSRTQEHCTLLEIS